MMERDWRMPLRRTARRTGAGAGAILAAAATLALSGLWACHHALENIPILSWLVLRGRCSACQASISPRYPLVEASSGLFCAFAAFHFGYRLPAAFGAMLLIWCLIALTFIDFDTQLLPDAITLPLLWAGLLFNVFATYTDLQSAVIGAMAAISRCGRSTGRSS
jgi:leader peptidase (prepilin peptidase)/N-methyltransferase